MATIKGVLNLIEKDRKKKAREHGKYLRRVVMPVFKKWMKQKGLKEAHFFNNDCLFVDVGGKYKHVEFFVNGTGEKNLLTNKEVETMCEIIDRFQMQSLSDYAPVTIKITR